MEKFGTRTGLRSTKFDWGFQLKRYTVEEAALEAF
jgi:hypothetical protein